MKPVKISIVIPTLNEAGNIPALVSRIDQTLKKARISYELIFIDDHSTDNTADILRQLADLYPIQLYLKRGNRGKAESLTEGFARARYDLVGIIDADLQYPPEVLPDMVKQIIAGSDIVVARRVQQHISLKRKIASHAFNTIFAHWLHGLDCDVQSGLKLFRREIIDEIQFRPRRWTFDMEFLLLARDYGYRMSSVDITFDERRYGTSKVQVAKAALEIGTNAVALKFKSRTPLQIKPDIHNMVGAGVALNRQRFITHTTLSPQTSAITAFTLWQKIFFFSVILLIIFGLWFNALETAIMITGFLSAIYFIDVLFNLYLVQKSLTRSPEVQPSADEIAALRDSQLPVYSILCPLYKEARVLPHFLEAIQKVDWPKNKLDVLLLLEADDTETISVIKNSALPRYVRPIIVPHSLPKTKPKACNYGLAFARGEFLVIYDAEDIPEPQQLKKAFLAFQKVPADVACLQAKLNYHNPRQNMLTRLFTAEYSLWFDVTLTGLQTMNTYIPLGGTSNHFRTKKLQELQGWDPFNVTEDCDLGIRLFRNHYKTAVIDSVTLEEANSNPRNWIRQRSRWMKGYMQTYLVHMRHPIQFARYNGIHALIFQLVVGGKIAFAMINPFLWLATIAYFTLYAIVGPTIEQLFPPLVFTMAASSLVFGNFLFLYYYMIGCAKRQHWSLVKFVYLVPFYWLMTSVASYIAFYQLLVRPHYWEKTHHGLHLKETTVNNTPMVPGVLPKVSFTNLTPTRVQFIQGYALRFRQLILSQFEEFFDNSRRITAVLLQNVRTVVQTHGQFGWLTLNNNSTLVDYFKPADQLVSDGSGFEEFSWVWDERGLRLERQSLGAWVSNWIYEILGVVRLQMQQLYQFITTYSLSGGSLLIAAMMVSNVFNLLFNAFLGRVLTFQDLGLITFLNTVWLVVGVLLSALSSTINHQSALVSAARGAQASVTYLTAIRRRSILISAVVSLLWIAAVPAAAYFFQISQTWVLWLYTPIWTFGVVANANSGFLTGTMRFKDVAAITLSESSTKLVTALLCTAIGHASFAYLAVPASIGVSALVSFYVLQLNQTKASRTSKPVLFDQKFYGAALLTSISSVIFLSIDMLLVKHYLPPDVAGQYALLALVGKMVYFLGTLPSVFMIVLVSRDIGFERSSQRTFQALFGASTILVGLVVITLIPLGSFIIPIIFGAKATTIVPYLGIYIPAIALLTLSSVIVSYHLAKKNYYFSWLYLGLAGVLAIGIMVNHSSIGAIASVVFIMSAFALGLTGLLHYLERYMVPLFDNARDLLGVFLPLPTADITQVQKRRILIFNWRDIKHSFAGGAEAYIHEMAKHWSSQGHYVTIFCGNDGHCKRVETIDGIHVIRRGGFYFVYFWAAIYYVFRFRGTYDLIIDCHNGIPFFTPLYSRKPVYCLMHHVHQEVFRRSLSKPLAWLAQFLEKKLMPVVYKTVPFITVSESSKKQILQLGLAHAGIEIVYPGVDLNELKPGAKSEQPTILYLGRLKAYKSIDVLLHAFRLILQTVPKAQLAIAGSGEEEKTLRSLSQLLGISSRVQFLGKVSDSEKITLLQRAWVLVNPSFMEGWGITTIEANACGTPVVASNVPGLRDSVVNPHTGYLVTYGDAAGFAEKILDIINDQKTRTAMNRQALLWAKNFDWHNTSQNFLSIINREFGEQQ